MRKKNVGSDGKKRTQVLSDHKRIKKRFIPPLQQIGPFHEVSWVDCILPELLWLGVLNDHFGLAHGTKLALSLARAAVKTCNPSSKKVWFAPTSAYEELSEEQKNQVVLSLNLSGDLYQLKEAFVPFGVFYPKCPLSFLFEGNLPAVRHHKKHLKKFKEILSPLFYRLEKETTFMQANAIYIAFVTDMLKVKEGLSLANFPAIEEYPNTEQSKKIASSIRSTMNAFFGHYFPDMRTPWAQYFWNRGLELEPCDCQVEYD